MLIRTILLFLCSIPSQLLACIVAAEMELSDIFLADAVITGRVENYQIVDVGERGPLPNYALFDVRISEVVSGDIAERQSENGMLKITWDNSTFGEPETFDHRKNFLFALRDPASPLPPLRTGSGVILPTRETNVFTVLQAPCAGAFIFEADSPIAVVIQQVLETNRDRLRELEILEEFLFERGAFDAMARELHLLRLGIERP